MDTIKTFLASRITQLICRYGSEGLIALATYLGVTASPEDVNTSTKVIATLIVAAIGKGVDHYSHSAQTQAPSGLTLTGN
jgi:hypothetical protein